MFGQKLLLVDTNLSRKSLLHKTSVTLATTAMFSYANEAINTIVLSASLWLQSNKYSQPLL